MTDPTQTLPATPPATPPAGGASAPQTIPYDRFRSVVAEKNSLTAQLAQMEAQLTAAQQRGATVDTLSQQLQQATTRATAAEGRFDTYTQIAGATGITDNGVVSAIEQAYQGIPEQGRPERDAWIAGLRADPTSAPALLRPHFTQMGAIHSPPANQPPAQRQPPAQQRQPAAQFPPTNQGAIQHQHAQQALTPEVLANMTHQQFLDAVPAIDARYPGLGLTRNPLILQELQQRAGGGTSG